MNANDPTTHAEDGFEEMQARAKSRGMKIPYVVDDTSGVARAFGASVTPEAFLFDKTGKLAYHGTIDDNRKEPDKVKARYLKDALDAVVAGKAPAVPETKGLGCGIKFRTSRGRRAREAMSKGRLEAFSDGVIAIIITIMVLEMKVAAWRGPRGAAAARARVHQLRAVASCSSASTGRTITTCCTPSSA